MDKITIEQVDRAVSLVAHRTMFGFGFKSFRTGNIVQYDIFDYDGKTQGYYIISPDENGDLKPHLNWSGNEEDKQKVLMAIEEELEKVRADWKTWSVTVDPITAASTFRDPETGKTVVAIPQFTLGAGAKAEQSGPSSVDSEQSEAKEKHPTDKPILWPENWQVLSDDIPMSASVIKTNTGAIFTATPGIPTPQHKPSNVDSEQPAPAEGNSADSGHFSYPPEKRREIVNAYREARRKGEINNKNSWAGKHGITGKTLLAYEREFPEET